jgi:hypothetical protein
VRPRIFISYRRDISASSAKLIYRKMADEFGKNNIFMDIDNLNPGEDWRETIKANIAKSDITLVLIERDWSSIATATGKRLSDTKDMVRVEVETALERRNRGHIVIPVLLNGASMPSPTELPGRLGELSDIHAASIDTGKNHEKDIEDLIKDMKQRISLKRLLIYVLTALIIGLVIGFIIGQQPLNLVISPLQTAVVALFPQPSVTPSSTSPIIIPPVVDPIPPSVAVLLPTDTPTLTSTVTETSTSTNTPTFTSTYTFTPSATSTITPTATDTPMPTPSATLTPSPSIDVTSTLSPTQTCDLFVCSVTATAQALLPPILDANNINEIQQIGLLDDFDSVITGMVVSPDGKWLAVSTNKGDVWLKDATILLNTLDDLSPKKLSHSE